MFHKNPFFIFVMILALSFLIASFASPLMVKATGRGVLLKSESWGEDQSGTEGCYKGIKYVRFGSGSGSWGTAMISPEGKYITCEVK